MLKTWKGLGHQGPGKPCWGVEVTQGPGNHAGEWRGDRQLEGAQRWTRTFLSSPPSVFILIPL